jgi:hypothetical protein
MITVQYAIKQSGHYRIAINGITFGKPFRLEFRALSFRIDRL